MIPYQACIKGLMEYFDAIVLYNVPREENQLADALATLSSMFELNQEGELPTIRMRSHEHPAYCHFITEELDDKPWYFDIKRYLKDREYPETTTKNDKRMLKRLPANFLLSWDVLYKRNVDAKEAKLILREVHEGTFGTHMNDHSMARKILRAGYFWLTIENNCCVHVRKCYKCQVYATKLMLHRHR